jgi:hypothetical protein
METYTPSPSPTGTLSASGSPSASAYAAADSRAASTYEDRVISQIFFVVTIMIPVLLSAVLLFMRRKARERAQRNHELMRAARGMRAAPPSLSPDEIAVLHVVPFDRAAAGSEFRCTICLEEPADGAPLVCLPCGHLFDQACAVAWFSRSTLCVLCKADALGREAPEMPPRSPPNVLVVREGEPVLGAQPQR